MAKATEAAKRRAYRARHAFARGLGAAFVSLSALAAPGVARADEGDSPEVRAALLVHMLTYVRSDYALAVQGGVIASQVEYAEQLAMLDDAARVAAEIQPAAVGDAPDLAAGVASLRRLVDTLAKSADVAEAASFATARVEMAMHLADAPPAPPDTAVGARLFAEQCATCHGATGRGDTERAASLTPRPVSFHRAAVSDGMSPARIASAIRFGVAGTAMIPFTFFTDEERWNVAFFAAGLRYADESASAPPSDYSLLQLTLRTDGDLRAELADRGVSEASREATVAFLRRRAPYDPKTNEGPVARARMAARRASEAAQAGDFGAARASLAEAAVGIEHLMAPLRAAGESPFVLDDALASALAARGKKNASKEQLEELFHTLDRETTYAATRLARPHAVKTEAAITTSLWTTLRAGAAATIAATALLTTQPRRASAIRWGRRLAGAALAGAAIALFMQPGRLAMTLQGAATLLAAACAAYASARLFARRGGDARATQGLAASAMVGAAAAALVAVGSGAAPLAEAGAPVWAAALGAALGALSLAGLSWLASRGLSRARASRAVAIAALVSAVLSAGAGVWALERATTLPLPLVAFARVPLLGLRPTLATSLAQGAVFLVTVALAIAFSFASRKEEAAPM